MKYMTADTVFRSRKGFWEALLLKKIYKIQYFGERHLRTHAMSLSIYIQGGSNMTGTDLYVNKPHCAAAVRP